MSITIVFCSGFIIGIAYLTIGILVCERFDRAVNNRFTNAFKGNDVIGFVVLITWPVPLFFYWLVSLLAERLRLAKSEF